MVCNKRFLLLQFDSIPFLIYVVFPGKWHVWLVETHQQEILFLEWDSSLYAGDTFSAQTNYNLNMIT